MNLKTTLVIGLLLGWSACATQRLLVEKKTPQEEAKQVIRNYVLTHGDSLVPNISTYKDAGIKDPELIMIKALNRHILKLKPQALDSAGKIGDVALRFQDVDQDKIPNFTDTDDDGDGYDDGYERSMNTDPLDATSNPGSTPFVFTVEMAHHEGFTFDVLPGQAYNYSVDCQSDGFMEVSGATKEYTCVFSEPGIYKISVYDNTEKREGFPQIRLCEKYDPNVLGINQWGTGKWTSFEKTFSKCRNLSDQGGAAIDAPDLSNLTSMRGMFSGAQSFNQNIGSWDTRHVVNMHELFDNAKAFNRDIGGWNTSGVTNMKKMFSGAEAFNQDIGRWDIARVKDMSEMFMWSKKFNQDIGRWDTSQVTNMEMMFAETEVFNQYIGTWDTHNVTNMRMMFHGSSFNSDIGAWNTSQVTNMEVMFGGARVFNQDIGRWDTSSVESMLYMFIQANTFNQDIGDWNTSKVWSMRRMFSGAHAFNQDIGDWDTSKVMSMDSMFEGASSFSNQDLSRWNVRNRNVSHDKFMLNAGSGNVECRWP